MNSLRLAFFALSLTVCAVSAQAQQKSQANRGYIEDSQRRQQLDVSARRWFVQSVLPEIRIGLTTVNGYGVRVTEPRTVLPPDLGGPLKMTEILIEASVSGWSTTYAHRHGRFSSFPQTGPAECRFKQKVWAYIDSRGRPTRLVENQRPVALIACASGGHFVPGYHGEDERYVPNF